MKGPLCRHVRSGGVFLHLYKLGSCITVGDRVVDERPSFVVVVGLVVFIVLLQL